MTEKPKISYLAERLCFALYSSSKAVISAYQPYLKKINMTYPQYLVYIVLLEKGKLAVNEIGELLFLDSGTLTPLLKRMEQNGLVTRQRADDDERRVFIELTEKALTYENDIAVMQKAVSKLVALQKDEFAELREAIKAVNKRVRKGLRT